MEAVRIKYIDALKCLGIFLVIEGHVRRSGMGIEVYDTIYCLMLYTFNMPLIFFISGFLAYKEQLSGGAFGEGVWKKAIYIVFPTLIVKSFFDLLNYKNPLSFFIHGLGGYWFGITLFECFFIYYVCWQDVIRPIIL